MSEHARLSFSGSDRWLLCPASVNMSAGIPDRASDAAREGTFAHKVMEQALKIWEVTGSTEIPMLAVSEQYADLNMDLVAMRDHIQLCVDYIVELYESLPGKNKGIGFEQRVSLHYMTNRDDLWGTSDVQIWSDMYLYTIDLKYGSGIFVEADTTQNRLYTLGKMCEFMQASRGEVPWVKVVGVIMQPRYPDEDGEIFRVVDWDPNELMDWFDTAVKPYLVWTDHPPEPNPGEKQCRFCRAKPTCPAAQAKVQESIPFTVHDEETVAIGDVEFLDIEKLIAIHDNIPFINGYLKAVTERLGELIKARDPALDGKLKMVRTRKQSKYSVSDGDVIKYLATGKNRTVKDGFIPRKTFAKEVPLSASQILKLKLNKQQRERVEEIVYKSEGSLSIVPWEDERANAFPPIPFESQDFDFL